MTIFQGPKRIAISLRDDTLTEREKLNFLWVLIAIAGIFGQASALGALRALPSVYGLIQLVPWGVQIWGIIASYRANRRGDNQNFIERFTCLTASLSLQAYLVYFVLTILVTALPAVIYLPQSSGLRLIILQLGAIGAAVYIYLRLKPLIAQVAGRADSTESLSP